MDNLGARMKYYEQQETGRVFDAPLPLLARMDGKGFHTLTKQLARPYDASFARAMRVAARDLLCYVPATVAYVQSDEITLLFPSPEYYWGGRAFKIVSHLAALTSILFSRALVQHNLYELVEQLPTFDARAWQVPDRVEATNVFMWRELDARRNAVQMAAQAVYSQPELHLKRSTEMLEMLAAKGIDFAAYPVWFQRGTYFRTEQVTRKFTTEELAALPPLHNAQRNPNLVFARTEYVQLEMPPLETVTNRVGVLFGGEQPVVKEE